jgi:hypothetical protein
MRDFYYILGADNTATTAEIKEAYRKLSKKFHPDLNPDDEYFESRFREIQEAYEVLSDPTRRNRYDNALNQFKNNSGEYKPPRQTYKAPSSTGKSKTRGLDLGFTFILFLITLIFGAYVVINLTGSKKDTINKTAPVVAVPLDKPKHHKKKHNSITKITTEVTSTSVKPDTTKKNLPVQAATVVVSAPIANKSVEETSGVLYTTVLRSNLTGVINMHESNNLSSKIITAIPTNSIVAVIEKGDSYYKVRYNDETGYVPKWTVKTK